jgi:hypothetical protein
MVNIIELCLSDLINKKHLLEGELERVINSNDIETSVKFNKTLDLLKEIDSIYGSIELLKNYITTNKNQTN